MKRWALGLALAVLGFAAPAAHAQTQIPPTGVGSATVVPLQVTGPPANRFDLVIVGDGYTAAEQDKFMSQVDKQLNVMWSIEPYKTYRDYINVYAVKVISGDSGVSCDPDLTSPRKTTPLSAAFWGGCSAASVQRLVTVNNSALNRYAALAPGVSQRLAIVNSNTYGGSGGAAATATGGNSMSALIAPHELGHSLGGLQDEYDYYTRGVPGGCYTGGEPTSVHHTLYTVDQMLTGHYKWWRWLGEPSEAGGLIGRYEGGMYFDSCIWRPSQHSIMKTLGYYYDQVSREVMTQKISGKVKLVDSSMATTTAVPDDRTLWLETQHPVDHVLNVVWAVDGTTVASANNARSLSLKSLNLSGAHTVTATVSDPTPFVRDPAIQTSAALTQKLTWTTKDAAGTYPGTPTPAAITGGSQTDRAVGRNDVMYVTTSHPEDGAIPAVTWKLDGTTLPSTDVNLPLAPLALTSGNHTLTATVGSTTRTWTVDAQDAVTSYQLSTPAATVSQPGAAVPEYVFKGEFTMKLTATDNQPGYVVPEFRVDGDGWENYYGWPTSADEPFHFSNTGTTIDFLNYGKLPYGHHVIEYRAIDAAGNVAAAKRLEVTTIDPSSGDVGTVGGSVPATLSLTLGTPASFGPFTPGVNKDYLTSMAADVITSAGNAALSVTDPSSVATGHLVNGSFSLPQALQVQASSPLGTGSSSYGALGTVLTYSTPASHDPVTIGFKQTIGAGDALRTGSYSKTLTFTLSTTNP